MQPLQVEGGSLLLGPSSVEDSLSLYQLEDQFYGSQEGVRQSTELVATHPDVEAAKASIAEFVRLALAPP